MSTPPTSDDDDFLGLLVEALDGAETDPVRLRLMMALALLESPVIFQDDVDRLRQYGPPPVMHL